MRSPILLLVAELALSLLLTASQGAAQEGLVISEFLAINSTAATDDFGEHSDYVELYNGTGIPIPLEGYYLTDSLANKTQWQFPSTNLLAGQHLVVWASGSDFRGPHLLR